MAVAMFSPCEEFVEQVTHKELLTVFFNINIHLLWKSTALYLECCNISCIQLNCDKMFIHNKMWLWLLSTNFCNTKFNPTANIMLHLWWYHNHFSMGKLSWQSYHTSTSIIPFLGEYINNKVGDLYNLPTPIINYCTKKEVSLIFCFAMGLFSKPINKP